MCVCVSGAEGQDQAFREEPDSVQVRAGSDVFLRCAVDHQHGKAQWTKDGFALGECILFYLQTYFSFKPL